MRIPYRVRAWTLSLLAAVWLAAPAFGQAPPAPAPEPPPTRAPSAEPASAGAREERGPIDVTGASTIEYDAQTEQYRFTGARVVVVRGEQRLTATEIQYDGAKRVAVLPHGGTVSTPTMELSADRITADLGRRHFLADGHVTGRMLDQGTWTRLQAAHLVADDRGDARRAEATGEVVAVREDQEVRGDRLIYDRLSGHSTVEGHAILTRGDDRLAAERIITDLATNDAQATGHVELDRKSTNMTMHGAGETVTYSKRSGTAVLSGHASVVREKDTVTADRITVHLDQNEAIADGHAVVVGYPAEQPAPAGSPEPGQPPAQPPGPAQPPSPSRP